MRLHAVLAACGGFLLAVLWFDLMFDTQVLGHAPAPVPLPEATLASIAHYYARVTGGAHPMQRLVALVMLVTVFGSTVSLWRTPRRPLVWLAFTAAVAPIGLAAGRVFPNAVRLGAGTAPLAEQTELARAVFADHVFCWLAIALFTALEIGLVTRTSSRVDPEPGEAVPR